MCEAKPRESEGHSENKIAKQKRIERSDENRG